MPNPGRPYESVSQVATNLFVGAKPPTGDLLRRLGISMLVLAADEHQPASEKFPGVEVLRPRLLDDGSETAMHVAQRACPYARRVYLARRRGRKVLSTCQWGYNRSAIVAGLSMRMDGMSAEEVLRRLRSARPSAEGFKALGSPEYEKALFIARC